MNGCRDPGSFGPDELRRAGEGALFGAGAPRLPAAPLLAFGSARIHPAPAGAHGNGAAEATGDPRQLATIFACHFRDDPILPGSLILDGLFQLTGLFAAASGFLGKGRAIGARAVSFRAEVTPAAPALRYRVDIRRLDQRRQIVIADGEVRLDETACLTASDITVWIRAQSRRAPAPDLR